MTTDSMDTHFGGERHMLEEARRYYAARMPKAFPGKRTMRELAVAAIPARLYFVNAVLALAVAVCGSVFLKMLHRLGFDGVATFLSPYAAAFWIMPPWFILMGSVSQVAARLNTAIDHIRDWLKSN